MAPEAAVVDAEATRIALANRVKDAEKALETARADEERAAKAVITGFSGFLRTQAGMQVGLFRIDGENLGKVNPQTGVIINGITAKITALRPTSIKGVIPQDVKAGKVMVKAGEATFEGKIT